MLVMDTSDIFLGRLAPPSALRAPPPQAVEEDTEPPPPPFKGEVSAKLTEGGATDPQDLTELTAALREQIIEAQDRLSRGDVKGAEELGRATLQLIRAVEAQVKLESSQKAGQREGVFFAREEIEAARAELSRRVERIAAHIRARAVDEGAS